MNEIDNLILEELDCKIKKLRKENNELKIKLDAMERELRVVLCSK